MTPTVHTYRSGETGLFVNSYLVEGAEGVVAIDSPLLLSDGRAFRARLEALKKPLLGMLVTHPHPDHYNTITDVLAGEDVPVIAHRDVDREIRAHDDAKRAQWGPMFGDEWPSSATFPNRTVADEETLELGDLRFTAWDFGPCESESETVWLLGDGDIAFVGDLAFNGTHAYLADGHTDAWLRALDRAEEAFAGIRTLFVGHGPPASAGRPGRAAPLPADGTRDDRARGGRPAAARRGRGDARGCPDGALPGRCSARLARRRGRVRGRRRAGAGGRPGMSAWQGLFDHGGLRESERVLIHGATGGVGQFVTRWRAASAPT